MPTTSLNCDYVNLRCVVNQSIPVCN